MLKIENVTKLSSYIYLLSIYICKAKSSCVCVGVCGCPWVWVWVWVGVGVCVCGGLPVRLWPPQPPHRSSPNSVCRRYTSPAWNWSRHTLHLRPFWGRHRGRHRGPKFPLLDYITQTIDGHAIGIGQPLGNSCAGPVLSAGIYGKRRGGKKVSGGGHWARQPSEPKWGPTRTLVARCHH